jgi:antitoxin MazE
MKMRVQRWGNSLGVRIPKAFAQQAGLQENTPITLSLIDGKLLIERIEADSFTLDDLLAGVNDLNVHAEVATGPATGIETWYARHHGCRIAAMSSGSALIRSPATSRPVGGRQSSSRPQDITGGSD